MRIYNVADRYTNLYVSYVRVESNELPSPAAVSKFFNIPIFLYDHDYYQLVMVDEAEGCQPYLRKIHKGVKDKEVEYYYGNFTGLNFRLDDKSEDGCFQCWEDECDLPY